VFIPGMEENIFPSARACYDVGGTGLEEERRLCYVGITRAKRRLHLLNASQRSLFGSFSWNRPSRFLEEIPEALVEKPGAEQSAARPASAFGGSGRYESGAFSQRRSPEASQQKNRGGLFPSHRPAGTLSSRPAAPSPKPKSFDLYARVRHDTFGTGVITEIRGSGNAMTVSIEFENGEVKKFAAAYAPIRPVE